MSDFIGTIREDEEVVVNEDTSDSDDDVSQCTEIRYDMIRYHMIWLIWYDDMDLFLIRK